MRRPVRLKDLSVEAESIKREVLLGLGKSRKELPSKLFYDARGSMLFDRITELPEYYPTRTEKAIMERYIGEMVEMIGPDTMLVEYGSGSSEKTKILLDHLVQPAAYVPIDISKDHLMTSAKKIAHRYPGIEVLPVCADYNEDFDLPKAKRFVRHAVVYYPGSTIGNFHRPTALTFLERIARVEGEGGGVLIGVDLRKDTEVLERAYNDAQGVTAEFNLNMLLRLNNEIGADFDLTLFRHHAFFNSTAGRIEMHLVSERDQTVHVDETPISFSAGESIWTESSYKYTVDGFADLAYEAGFDVDRVWTDEASLFSVQYLSVRS